IVGTKVNHRSWSPVVIDGRARVGTGEQLRFIKFDRKRGLPHPMRESGWRLERIARFLCQKITQTEFCRVLIHQIVRCFSLTPTSTGGVSQQSREFLWFTDSLRSSPLHRQSSVSGQPI